MARVPFTKARDYDGAGVQSAVRYLATNMPVNTTNAITASASSDQAGAVALTTGINRVTTVGSAGDSVRLPAATAGKIVVVINAAAANSMDVFPATGEVINALAANTALACAANKTQIYICAVAGTWNCVLTA
jgi:molybdopterin synthase catalytic subunit